MLDKSVVKRPIPKAKQLRIEARWNKKSFNEKPYDYKIGYSAGYKAGFAYASAIRNT